MRVRRRFSIIVQYKNNRSQEVEVPTMIQKQMCVYLFMCTYSLKLFVDCKSSYNKRLSYVLKYMPIVNIYIIMKACGQRFDRQHLIHSRASGLVSKSSQT